MTNTDKNWKVPETDDNAAEEARTNSYSDLCKRRPYNDTPCGEGERLVPFFTTHEDAVNCQFNMKNLETWKIKGHKILVGFTPVKEPLFDAMLKVFYQDVHAFINRDSSSSKFISLSRMWDDMLDEDNSSCDPTATTEAEEMARAELGIRMLITYYDDAGEHQKAQCIQMLADGFSKGEICKVVFPELKKSRAYDFIKQTQREGYRLYRERFDLNR